MNRIITVSREFGSGGREVGKRLADKLEIAYYDKEIIQEMIEKTGLQAAYLQAVSERGMLPYAFQFGKSFAVYSKMSREQTEILVEQQKVIKELAKKGDCVIVGRGANLILQDYQPMNLFIYADTDSKIQRCRQKGSQEEHLTDKEIASKMQQIDKQRKKYQEILSNLEWGKKENYHLCINTSNLEIKSIIPSLGTYIQNWFERREKQE